MDHEPDDFARGEVVAGGLVGQFVETADKVFKDQPHRFVGHLVGVEIHFAELGDDQVKDVRLAHLLDLGLKLEKLENRPDVLGEALDIADEVFIDVVRIAFELLESEGRMVVEPLTGGVVQDLVQGFVAEFAAFAPLIFGQHSCFG